MEMHGFRVRPEQFLGLEINKQAVAIAQLVLWIGYFQWQRKTTGKADTGDRPLLPKDKSIFEQDAVLAYDERTPRLDPETGKYLTIWDGQTTKIHPVTGKEVPDESARTLLFDYKNPRRAEWPQADYIVGNPPFIGVRKMVSALGEGYVNALRKAYTDVPETSDLVGYWWHKAAILTKAGKLRRFGLITTNSIIQEYSSRVLDQHLEGSVCVSLLFAVADHPWVDTAEGAAVRVAMHVVGPGKTDGVLAIITEQYPDPTDPGTAIVKFRHTVGVISSQLAILNEGGKPTALKANEGMCFQGVVPAGDGFKLTPDSPLAIDPALHAPAGPIRNYLIGKDLVQEHTPKWIIDCFGMGQQEVAANFPEIYQHLLLSVKPERDHNRRQSYKEKWWIFAEPRPSMRKALDDLHRFIGTPYTAKYRPFVFVEGSSVPDAMVYAIASDDAYILGVLSSRIHALWAKSAGGTLEDRPRYNSNATFLPFPFPALGEGKLKTHIRDLGERLDAHRKRQQALHPDLTLTGLYNVLEKLRTGEALTPKDRDIHDKGLVTLLKQIHDDLDTAVLEAFGWTDILHPTPAVPVAIETTMESPTPGEAPMESPTPGEVPMESPTPAEAPKVRSMLAQGNALGTDQSQTEALKGRPKIPGNTLGNEPQIEPPLQGSDWVIGANPGRCPGLTLAAPLWLPSGQSASSTTTTAPTTTAPTTTAPTTTAPTTPATLADIADILARGGPEAEALEQTILTRLVALNHERAAEEKRGIVHWLRPDFQAPGETPAQQSEIGLPSDTEATPETTAVLLDWPADLPAQVAAIRKLLPTTGPDAETLAACFGRKTKKRTEQITAILATLKALGLIG